MENEQTNFDLFKGRYSSQESFWKKIIVYLIIVIFWLGALLIIREYILPAIGLKKITGVSIPEIVKLFRGGSP